MTKIQRIKIMLDFHFTVEPFELLKMRKFIIVQHLCFPISKEINK